MICCIFTLDYELYGDGTGSLSELVYSPAEQLVALFKEWDARFVAFVEVAELARIDACRTDPAIDLVKRQIRRLYRDGFEIGLHLHPQWFNGQFTQNGWRLDLGEYNLCTLPRTRIADILQHSLAYLRHVVDEPTFIPLSFRAGNWLFQPTDAAASVLAEQGIRIDSSVFKGGHQHAYGLDYRPARRNGYSWRFSSDVNREDPSGHLIEVPIHTEMVPFWKMATPKRMSRGNSFGVTRASARGRISRAFDFLRLRYPMKLDFCRMTLDELTSTVSRVIREDRREPMRFRPLVAIGHTKDFDDPDTLSGFLSFLRQNRIPVSTFEDVYPRLSQSAQRVHSSALSA